MITIQECKFIKQIKPKCNKFYDKYLPSYCQRNKGSLSFNKIRHVKAGKLFGALEVDIRVKPQFVEKISRISSFFSAHVMLKWKT